MGAETMDWYRSQILASVEHGMPWWNWNGAVDVTDDDSTTLYPGAVPLQRVRELMRSANVVSAPLQFVPPNNRTDAAIVKAIKAALASKGSNAEIVEKINSALGIVVDSSRQVIARESTNDVHGVFGADSYTVHQFEDTLVDKLANVVGESPADLHVVSAGLLSKGAEGWVSIATADLYQTPQGVEYYPFLMGSTAHNGTLASTFLFHINMVICDNTRAAALGNRRARRASVKHTKFSATQLERVQIALGFETACETFESEVKFLSEIDVTIQQFEQILAEVAPISDDDSKAKVTRRENERDALRTLYRTDSRVSHWQGTAFGVLQALNTFEQWERPTRGETIAVARTMREAITGKVAETETSNRELILKVLDVPTTVSAN